MTCLPQYQSLFNLITEFPNASLQLDAQIPTASSSSFVQERRRTRGIQSSIATAMALKEKRSTLSEAKDIRKAKQQQIQTEFQEHHRQQTQISYQSAETDDEEKRAKKVRLDLNQKELGPSSNTSSHRSSVDSLKEDEATTNKLQEGEFNEEVLPSQQHDNGEGEATLTTKIKLENKELGMLSVNNTTWSSIDLLLNRDAAGKEMKSTIELVGETETNQGSVNNDDDDLVSDCISQSRDAFPNVEELVSGLASATTAPMNIPTSSYGITYVVHSSNNSPVSAHSPRSSQACSSITS